VFFTNCRKGMLSAITVVILRLIQLTWTVRKNQSTNRQKINRMWKKVMPIGKLDHSLALSTMNALDFGVVAADGACMANINSKMWEYLALNLSMLGIVHPGGSKDSLISAGNCGYVFPYDAESMLPVLETALSDFEDNKVKRASSEFIQQPCVKR